MARLKKQHSGRCSLCLLQIQANLCDCPFQRVISLYYSYQIQLYTRTGLCRWVLLVPNSPSGSKSTNYMAIICWLPTHKAWLSWADFSASTTQRSTLWVNLSGDVGSTKSAVHVHLLPHSTFLVVWSCTKTGLSLPLCFVVPPSYLWPCSQSYQCQYPSPLFLL